MKLILIIVMMELFLMTWNDTPHDESSGAPHQESHSIPHEEWTDQAHQDITSDQWAYARHGGDWESCDQPQHADRTEQWHPSYDDGSHAHIKGQPQGGASHDDKNAWQQHDLEWGDSTANGWHTWNQGYDQNWDSSDSGFDAYSKSIWKNSVTSAKEEAPDCGAWVTNRASSLFSLFSLFSIFSLFSLFSLFSISVLTPSSVLRLLLP
jgi:hypothetical protein